MSSEQKEEIEVLRSIFDCDEAAKFVEGNDGVRVQYLIGEPDDINCSFLIEFNSFVDGYPELNGPHFTLDLFYNKHLLDGIKANICQRLKAECLASLGSPMIYALIEFLKENLNQLMVDQCSTVERKSADIEQQDAKSDAGIGAAKTSVCKEQLSKAQKRKMWDRGEGAGEKIRGFDWVDVVKHLSQTGASNAAGD